MLAFQFVTLLHRSEDMDPKILTNVLKFLERVSVTGAEAYAWAEAHSHVLQLVQRATAPPAAPPPVTGETK